MKTRRNPFMEGTSEARAYDRARLEMFDDCLRLATLIAKALSRRRFR